MNPLMAFMALYLTLFLSLESLAQLVVSPNPINDELSINSSNSYIYFSNNGSSNISLNLSINSNPQGINLSVNRCPTVLKPKISCYVIVSYPNYNKNSSLVNVSLQKDSSNFILLKYSPTIVVNESLSISPSSLNFGSFSKPNVKSALHNIVITNNGNVPYIPILDKSSSVEIVLNRCSSTLAPNKSCAVSVKFNSHPSMVNGAQSGLFFSAKSSALASPSNVSLNANINYPIVSPPVMTGISYSLDRTRVYISGSNFGSVSSVQIFQGITEIDSLIIENQTLNLLTLKFSKDITLVSGIDYIFRLL